MQYEVRKKSLILQKILANNSQETQMSSPVSLLCFNAVLSLREDQSCYPIHVEGLHTQHPTGTGVIPMHKAQRGRTKVKHNDSLQASLHFLS